MTLILRQPSGQGAVITICQTTPSKDRQQFQKSKSLLVSTKKFLINNHCRSCCVPRLNSAAAQHPTDGENPAMLVATAG